MTKINLFHNAADIQTFRAGEIIFTEGEVGMYLYDVVEGEVDLLYRDCVINTLHRGEIFGEIGLIKGAPHSVTARTHTDCRIAQISLQRFLFMVNQTPNFAIHVMQVLAERLQKETRQRIEARLDG